MESFHTFFGLEYSSLQRIIFYYVILVLALLTNFFTLRIRKLPVGRAWEALREDEIACRSLGINPTNTKLTAFAIGAMFGGFAGSFFATRQGFISPESFTFIESAVILAIVVLGGMGSQVGGTAVLIGGTELFRELEEYRMLAFGGAKVMIHLEAARPSGAPGSDDQAGRRPGRDHDRSRSCRQRSRRRAGALTVDHLTMQFGGLIAIDDLSMVAGQARSPRSSGQRRRQDHGLQPDRVLRRRRASGPARGRRLAA